ncbi:MAG: ATP-binding protein [Bdellovibrionales bacterium]
MSAAKKLEELSLNSFDPAQWNRRILVVEDQKEIADSYLGIFEAETNRGKGNNQERSSRSFRSKEGENIIPMQNSYDFDITIVSNASEAIKVVKSSVDSNKPFAMGFIDVLLGEGVDGIELVKEIQLLDPNFYSVFVTAYNDRDVHSIDEFLGAEHSQNWDYLNKPFTNSEILQKARNFTSLWNLSREKEFKDKALSELQERMLESERQTTVSAVSRGLGHEFGNILVQIMGKSDLGRNLAEDKMKDSLEKIFQASLRAKDILERFNELSKGSARREKKIVDINKLVDSTLDLMEHQIKVGGIKVCKIKSDKISAWIDETAISQVLVNLVINATHAMPHGGQMDISIVKKPDKFQIIIRDYGIGIPDEILEKVTESFFSTKGEKGTGLGLAICKEIIEIEHNGKLKLSNHEMRGLEVTLEVPIKGDTDG